MFREILWRELKTKSFTFISIARTERWRLFLLFGVALLVRILYISEASHHPLFNVLVLDEKFHDEWAKSIAGGNLFGDVVFFRAPLYPYFLGTIYWIFGHNDFIVRIIQLVLGSISVILLYSIGLSLFGRKAAIVGSLLYALYPLVFYFEAQLLFESILNFQLILLFVLLVFEGENSSYWDGCGSV